MADIKINGATPSAFYVGGTAATAVYYGSTKLWPLQPSLPAYTIRCKFSSGYTPTMGTSQTLVDADENIWDIDNTGGEWFNLLSSNTNLLEVLDFNTTGITSMFNLFKGCSNLTTVSLFDTSSVTTMNKMFYSCSHLTSVPLFNTSSVTNMENMFAGCTRLTSVPLFDTSSVHYMSSMFINCTGLTAVPLFDTRVVSNMNKTFSGCTRVESGALALYQQASTQTTPPEIHTDTFKNCGSDTVSGTAELAQIPTSWGGGAA